MMVKLYVLRDDPDTEQAGVLLSRANVGYSLIDVESSGILPFLDRDLGVSKLPFIITENAKFEGLDGIREFATRSA